MSKKPLGCHHCGQHNQRLPGAGLFCGADCEKQHGEAIVNTRKTLAANGFVQHHEVSNIWTKNGVAVTEEMVKHVGIDKTSQRHLSAVAENKSSA